MLICKLGRQNLSTNMGPTTSREAMLLYGRYLFLLCGALFEKQEEADLDDLSTCLVDFLLDSVTQRSHCIPYCPSPTDHMKELSDAFISHSLSHLDMQHTLSVPRDECLQFCRRLADHVFQQNEV